MLTERTCCLHCGYPLTENRNHCGDCLKHNFLFNELHALSNYQPPFPQLIKQLKYHNQLINAELLGQLLARSIQQRYSQEKLLSIDYVIPVPLHNRKLRSRGFNQSKLISDALLKQLNLTTPSLIITRNKSTQAQEGLTRSQRKRNLNKAFALPDKLTEKVKNKKVVLIDDVVTTGATINALCEVLIKAQVKQIDVWCICRTELN